MPRISDSEMKRRVADVLGRMQVGIPTAEIVQEYSERYGIQRRQVEAYITRAKKMVREIAERPRGELAEDFFTQYQCVYRMAMKKGDARTAKEALDRMAQMLGMSGACVRNITAEMRSGTEGGGSDAVHDANVDLDP